MEEDVERVLAAAMGMAGLCHAQIGGYQGGLAIAHPQIDDKDPLRFFVTSEGQIIINPMITRHTGHKRPCKEGCLTFYFHPPEFVGRYYKCEVSYRTITDKEELSEIKHKKIKGLEAQMYQHEINHLDCQYVYDKSIYNELYTDPESALRAIEASEGNFVDRESGVSQDREDDRE